MTKRRLLAAVTLGVLVGCCTTLSQASDFRQPLELAWFNNLSSQVDALTRQPVECIKPLESPKLSLGRLAFNSPRLLGGQAGRMGLSCASCHPSGRSNDNFFIKQISDEPGRADISHHFLSSQGGDTLFNPKPIPDLADVENLRFKNRNNVAFDNLLTQLIEVEFDGQPTTPDIFSALKFYLAQNDVKYCDSPTQVNIRNLDTDWALIDDGLKVLNDSAHSNNLKTTQFVSATMRSVLETLYRFYAVNSVASIDKKLTSISRSLAALTDEGNAADLKRVSVLSARLSDLKADLQQQQHRSFYNAEVAVDYLNRPN